MTTPSGLAYGVTPIEGVNLAVTYVSNAQTPEYPAPPFALGQSVQAVDDAEYVFVKFAGAYPLGSVVYFDANWNATAITTANAAAISGQQVGVMSQVASLGGDYGFVQKSGLAPAILVAAATAANAQLYTTTTAGELTSVATGAVAISGIILTTAEGGAAGVAPGLLNSPEVLLPG